MLEDGSVHTGLLGGLLALAVFACTPDTTLPGRADDRDVGPGGEAGTGADRVSTVTGGASGKGASIIDSAFVGSAAATAGAAGASAGQDSPDRGGTSAQVGAAGADIREPEYSIEGWMTAEEWAAASGVYAGKRVLFTRGCASERIPQEYLIDPTVSCRRAVDYDFETNPIRICDVEPFCTTPDDCTEQRFGSCRAVTHTQCDYGIEREPCADDSDCRTLTAGSCLTANSIGYDVHCYPTGECDDRKPRCYYPGHSCSSDADCTEVPGGTCKKSAYYAGCRYDECLADTDCAPGSRCACSELFERNECVPADCASDDTCPSGQTCRLEHGCHDSVVGYHCTTPDDTCKGPNDCSGAVCEFFDARWQCKTDGCLMTP